MEKSKEKEGRKERKRKKGKWEKEEKIGHKDAKDENAIEKRLQRKKLKIWKLK